MDTEGTLTMILDGIGCSNGMAFTPDRSGFYYTDSFAGSIYRFDFDEASGELRNQSVFHSVPENKGFPDGCTVDSEGHLWFALWGGSAIVRLDPSGRVDSLEQKRTRSQVLCFVSDQAFLADPSSARAFRSRHKPSERQQ